MTVSDQAGKQRKSVSDALGRVTRVHEAPNDTTNFNFQTSYKYDVLGNLRLVTQGSQKRYFLYDSLSRLIRTRNPELDVTSGLNLSSDALTENNGQWSLGYTYDNNGNLLTKTDPRNTTATYVYDGLNRVTQRSYSGGTAVATPTVNYTYDASGVANSKGRLTSVSSSVSAFNYTGYDALGRITGSQQITDGQTYSMAYEYDLAGNMTTQAYPTGRVVTQSFDSAQTFVYNIAGQLVAEYATSTTLNNGTSYLTSDTLGTPRVITKADGIIRARHDYLPFGEVLFADAGNLTNDGNGNLLTNTDARNTTTIFTYDGLNRVTQRRYSGGGSIMAFI